MHIIAVDDEVLTLAGMERIIKEAIPGCTLYCFDTPEDALSHVGENRVDLAFLDIEMGGMNGLELAKAMKDVYGKTNIVFVTGYSEYAVASYEVSASDYLLKPITKEAVENAINRLRSPIGIKSDKTVRVHTFGNFEVFVSNKPLAFSRSQAKQVLAYLIDRQGASVTTAEIAAILWEDREYDTSLKNQTQKVISEMIKTLRDHGVEDIIIKNWNQLSVDKSKIDCDFYEFLNWNTSAVNTYFGEYMAQYSWAEMTCAVLSQRTQFA
jgi:two-component SAPR family response regulator